MSLYPINLELSGRRCAVIGGGRIAERKVKSLLSAGAEVTVISLNLTGDLEKLAEENKITYHAKSYSQGDLHDFFLVVCATDKAQVNLEAGREGKQQGALVNLVDSLSESDFTFPALVKRGDLVLAVSTGGGSPAFSRLLKKDLESRYGEEYGLFLRLIAEVRLNLKEKFTKLEQREAFWQSVLTEEIFALLKQGKLEAAKEKVEHAISSFRA